jgi:2-enoate reductase
VTADLLRTAGIDAAILSTGSMPIMPNLPGIDDPKVCSCVDALLGKHKIGEKVVIVGGGLVGCEMAFEYAAEGKNVTVVEALDDILSVGEAVPLPNSVMLRGLLEYHKVKLLTGRKIKAVDSSGAVIEPSDGKGGSTTITADTVVIAIGFKPAPGIEKDLYGDRIEFYQIGDGKKVGNIMTAVGDAYEVARAI